MEMTVDQFDRLDTTLANIRDEVGEFRTEQALQRQELGQIRDHLVKLNGRTGKSEDRIGDLDKLLIEARGAWKAIAAIASAVGFGIKWALDHLGKN